VSDARLHATLRFAVGVTGAFVLCELAGWLPSFIAAVLAAALLANLPVRPPPKVALVLILSTTGSALLAFVLASWFRLTPTILFGLLGLCMFLAFHVMLGSSRAAVPALLLSICLATIPVVTMVAPAQGGILPLALVRGIVVALAFIAIVHVAWPQVAPPQPAQAQVPRDDARWVLALAATAVVLPLMFVYLLFGLVDVLPVMIATVMLVANFDPTRSRRNALGMIVGNFAGGLLGMLMHTVLMTAPGIWFLAGLLFLVLLAFGARIAAGGPSVPATVIACNAMLIIFGSAIASGSGSLSLWIARLFQFTLAGAFAVGMMELAWQHVFRARAAASPRAPPEAMP
jgi:hypothetical protein